MKDCLITNGLRKIERNKEWKEVVCGCRERGPRSLLKRTSCCTTLANNVQDPKDLQMNPTRMSNLPSVWIDDRKGCFILKFPCTFPDFKIALYKNAGFPVRNTEL